MKRGYVSHKKKSFGGIPNSSMNPYAMFHQPVFKTITWLLLSRLPRRNSLEPEATEPSGTPPEPTPAHGRPSGTLRNPAEPDSGNYTRTHSHRNAPEPSGTFLRNLLLRPAPVHTGAYLGWRPCEPTLLGKKGFHMSQTRILVFRAVCDSKFSIV